MNMRDCAAWAFGIGWFGNAFLFLPQIAAVWRRKSSAGVSLITFGGFTAVQILAVIHGLQVHDRPMLIGWGTSLLTCAPLTALTIYYRVKNRKVNQSITN